MLEPPDLSDDVIVTSLRANFGLDIATLEFLPIGLDSAAWAYRVRGADGSSLFLKVRRGAPNQAGLLLPDFLRRQGGQFVIPPVASHAGTLYLEVDGFSLIVYPFVEAETATDRGMTERHWKAYGAAVRAIHDTTLTSAVTANIRHETFTPARADLVRRLDEEMSSATTMDPVTDDLRAFWIARRSEIADLVEHAEQLGKRVETKALPMVLCHGDIHAWNVLIDASDALWIVDWDDALLAARECDLMFGIGGLSQELVSPQQEAWFVEGYGPYEVDTDALVYYRFARVVDEIAAFGDSALDASAGELTRRDAAEGLKRLFARGQIVELAHASLGTHGSL